MAICNDCPRACGVDRRVKRGYCGCGENAVVAKTISPFEYEEPCLGRLSAVFFGGCALRCSYCQNVKISRGAVGREYSDAELARLFDETDRAFDLVTPSHFLGAIERALALCEKPHRIIYNTSGYETESAVERAAKFTDVFLTDLKYFDGAISSRYSAASDYFEHASRAVKLMRELIPDDWETSDGGRMLKRGLVIRHLVLPEHCADSMKILDFIAENIGTDAVVSIMSQFTPNGIGEPSARLKKIEYKLVREHALKLGFRNGYVQDFSSASAAYTPKF